MTIDAKELVEPSTTIPLPEPAAEVVETSTSTPPPEDKGSETPVASPATSAESTPPSPTKVVDERGDEMTPEEQDVMARLTGQKTDEKKTEEVPPEAASKETPPPTETKEPAETVEEVAGVKLPSSHELAAYKPETRKRIEQFTAKLRETAPAASEFVGLVRRFEANGVTPEQFHAWQSLGTDLRSRDPNIRREATEALHAIARQSGLAQAPAPAPDYTPIIAKIAELEKGLEIDPTHAEALRSMLQVKTAPAAPAAHQPPPVQQFDPKELVAKALAEQNLARANYDVQEAIAEATAQIAVTEHDAFKADVMSEIARVEASMPPAELNNLMKWRSRTANAAKTVLARRQSAAPATKPTTKPFRPTTPNQDHSDDPKPGTEAYDLGVLMGKIQIQPAR